MNILTEEKTREKEGQVVSELTEEEETKQQNLQKLKELNKKLDEMRIKKDPNIRICPKCFSTRVKVEDIFSNMGITQGYPVCRCLDCGWRSRTWIYLDRTMSKEERERFIQEEIELKSKK